MGERTSGRVASVGTKRRINPALPSCTALPFPSRPRILRRKIVSTSDSASDNGVIIAISELPAPADAFSCAAAYTKGRTKGESIFPNVLQRFENRDFAKESANCIAIVKVALNDARGYVHYSLHADEEGAAPRTKLYTRLLLVNSPHSRADSIVSR